MEDHEPKYQLSVREIEDARASKFWLAIEERIDDFLDDIHLAFEDLQNELGDYKHLSGNALTLRRMKVLPDVLIVEAQEREERIRLEQEENHGS